MLFITNRFPTQSIRSRNGRRFTFDLSNNAPSNSVYFCERGEGGHHTEIGNKDFFDRLRNATQRQLLLYIHGFSNLPEVVFEAAEELQKLCNDNDPNEILVVPLIWPCDNDLGIVGDYWDDQKAADASSYSFARVLQKFLHWREELEAGDGAGLCSKRINVLAHSMGNRVLRETLVMWNHYDLQDGVPLLFRNAFLFAADVVNESIHTGQRADVISHAARNVVAYYASDDLALRASKAANLKNRVASRRLGHTGPEDMRLTPANVYAIDCDNFNLEYDAAGHSYFRSDPQGNPGLAFKHMYQCMIDGRVPPCKNGDRFHILG